MAIINTFLSLQTDGAGGTLIVRGETVDENGEPADLGHDAQIAIAVIRVGNPNQRTDLVVEGPATNPWMASTGSHHLNEGDEVYAVGALTQKSGNRPRLFADGFSVTLK